MTAHGRYGHIKPTPDARDRAFKASKPYTGVFVDLAGKFPEKPYDQLQLGSCVSNGVAAALDFVRMLLGLGPLKRPARLFIYWNGRKIAGYAITQDTGLQIRDGIKAVAKYGAPPEDVDCPYDITKFTVQPTPKAYTDGALDEALAYGAVAVGDIDATIASGYPIPFGFTVYASFEDPETASTGVMPLPKPGEKQLGGHCVVVVSTVRDGKDIPGAIPGVLYRKCRNSWGHDGTWGDPADPGHFWMPASFMEGPDASDFWVITTAGDPNAPKPHPPAPPGPPSFPGALVAAAQALGNSPAVATFLSRHHTGQSAEIAGLIHGVLAAPRA